MKIIVIQQLVVMIRTCNSNNRCTCFKNNGDEHWRELLLIQNNYWIPKCSNHDICNSTNGDYIIQKVILLDIIGKYQLVNVLKLIFVVFVDIFLKIVNVLMMILMVFDPNCNV